MFWLSDCSNLHNKRMILSWLVLTFQIRAVKCVKRNELDIWSYCWNLCGKQEKHLQTTEKQVLNIKKGKIMQFSKHGWQISRGCSSCYVFHHTTYTTARQCKCKKHFHVKRYSGISETACAENSIIRFHMANRLPNQSKTALKDQSSALTEP